MKKCLPGKNVLLMFAVLAVVCALIVVNMQAHDAGLSLMAFPLFLFAAMMGLWKSGRLRRVDE